MVLRFWAWPRTTPGDGGGEPALVEAVGVTRTGPLDTGGMNGASMDPVRPSSNSFDPAVIAARVGNDASPTSITTMST